VALAARLERRGPTNTSHAPRGIRSRLGSTVELTTRAGRAAIWSDGESTTETNFFAAGWEHALDAPPFEDVEALRSARPGAFVAASSEGLEIERGPYGGRPLYYAYDADGASVSSSLAGLLEALPERPALNVDRLGALGVTRIGPDPRATAYRGVFRVLPCEVIRFGADGTTRSSFRLPRAPVPLCGDVFEHARVLVEMLDAILARELRPFSAVAVQTGGGLDSAGVFALVSRLAKRAGSPRYTALAMDFAGPGDDRPHLRTLLEQTGADALRVSPGEVGPLPLCFFAQDAWPYTWPTCPVGEVLDRRARAWGADAMVTGFGGDFVLDGDLGGFADRARSGDVGAILDAGGLQVPWPSSALDQVFRFVAKPLARPFAPASWVAYRHARARAASQTLRWAGPRLRPLLEEPLNERAGGDDWLTAFATSYAMMEGADGVGQTEAAWGTPYVTPYLDPRFIELVASLPPAHLFAGGRMRGLFRVAMEGLLPDSLRLRPDKASFEPMLDQMFAAAGGMDRFRALLQMEATADLGLVEPSRFREMFTRVVDRVPTARGWLEVWPMLAVEAFVQGSGASVAAPVAA
jgi:asparagine synthase (glutamine-hydrolysing)